MQSATGEDSVPDAVVSASFFDGSSVELGYVEALSAVAAASAAAGASRAARLVAVSKTKPVGAVLAAYAAGARHFGENYVQEIVEKAPLCPADIAWHFIGQLQSNKAKALVAGVPSLWAVESVDSAKLAGLLDKAAAAAGRGRADAAPAAGGSGAPPPPPPLRVYVQVNTSREPQKGGVELGEAAALASFIVQSCPHLRLQGLMTIGAAGEDAGDFFAALRAERDAVRAALGAPYDAPDALELSMGMSGDFVDAIREGSSSVRIGSAIFGARERKE
jgi:pyridoxal phosphate enzyme (YggS family)